MSDVVQRLATLMNEHDLQGAAALMHRDYRSAQPAHPGRAFVGRAQMEANWQAMFDGIPDFHAELIAPSRTVRRPGPNGTGRGPAAMVSPLRCAV